MKKRNVAIAIFYDSDNNIYFQSRKSNSKVGEKYGFFGGGIHKDETPQLAIERELLEEMHYQPKELIYWDAFNYTVFEESVYKDWEVHFHVFVSPVEKGFEKRKVTEGDGILVMSLEKVIEGDGFPKGSTKFMEGFASFLEEKGV